MKERLIIVNHIGTSVLETVQNELVVLVKDIQRMKPDSDVVLAFSSDRARRKLGSKGIELPNMQNALERGIEADYKAITILPLHVVGGTDYRHLSAVVEVLERNIQLCTPLISNEMGCSVLANAIKQTLSEEDRLKEIVVVGHGTTDVSNGLYRLLEEQLKALNLQAKVITLADSIDDLTALIKGSEVVLYPLFTVSGYHLKKDVFESESSIQQQLINAGYDVSAYAHGLLEFAAIRALYLKKL